MADSESATHVPESTAGDVEMAGAEEVEGAEIEDGDLDGPAGEGEENGASVNPQTVFLDFLKSPIVELNVGGGGDGADEEATLLTAHQAILTQSPFFSERLENLGDGDSRRIDMPDETLDTVGCFLQYQYTGEYFPRRLPSVPDGLETDPSCRFMHAVSFGSPWLKSRWQCPPSTTQALSSSSTRASTH